MSLTFSPTSGILLSTVVGTLTSSSTVDWNPTALSGADVLIVESTVSGPTLHSLVATTGSPGGGRVLWIVNTTGTPITIKHLSGSAGAGYAFSLWGAADLALASNQAIGIAWVASNQGWHQFCRGW
jgi:hypothetical protein